VEQEAAGKKTENCLIKKGKNLIISIIIVLCFRFGIPALILWKSPGLSPSRHFSRPVTTSLPIACRAPSLLIFGSTLNDVYAHPTRKVLLLQTVQGAEILQADREISHL
jgi:hypothetical protein